MMQYTCSVAMGPIDQLIEIAKTAEEVGFDSIALPDSVFYMEKQSADYPYTARANGEWFVKPHRELNISELARLISDEQ